MSDNITTKWCLSGTASASPQHARLPPDPLSPDAPLPNALPPDAARSAAGCGEGVRSCDVLIIGGGPAGATAAALLAERGRDVVLLEQARHPRFHIGESLLPANMPLIDHLGLRDTVTSIGVRKPGAEFVSDAHRSQVAFAFKDGVDKRFPYSYQVKRDAFDAALFAAARSRGADCAEEIRVTDVAFTPGSRAAVTAVDGAGATRQYAPRFVLDASGRDTFLAASLQLKETDKAGNTAAVFGHYAHAACRTGELEGYITVHLVDDGWFWMIPLPDDLMSVGFVGTKAAFRARQGSMADFMAARIAASPSVAARMACAELVGEVRATGNYAYKARTAVGDGYMLIGDAFAFLDPVFSSGVLLAMTSGETAAAVADTWLDDAVAGARLARAAEVQTRRAMNTLRWLITRINSPVLRDLFMSPNNRMRMRDGLVSLLAGNVHGGRRVNLPVLAFKSVYYTFCGLARLGLRLHPSGQVLPRSRWAAATAELAPIA